MKKRIFGIAAVLCFLFASALCAQSPKMAEALQPFIDSGEMPGIVSVLATKDQVIQIDCVGYAHVENKTPIAAVRETPPPS